MKYTKCIIKQWQRVANNSNIVIFFYDTKSIHGTNEDLQVTNNNERRQQENHHWTVDNNISVTDPYAKAMNREGYRCNNTTSTTTIY